MNALSVAFDERIEPGDFEPIAPESMRVSVGDSRIALYGDDAWNLAFLTDNPSSPAASIYWKTFSVQHRPAMRLAAWTLINVPIPSEILRLHGPSMRPRLSAFRIYQTVLIWNSFARWLDSEGLLLRQVTTDQFAEYTRYLAAQRRLARNTVIHHVTALTRLWIAGQVFPGRLFEVAPPWVTGDAEDYLPKGVGAGENVREPIQAAVIGPLLHWALLVLDCAPSILHLTEQEECIRIHAREARTLSLEEERTRLKAYFADLQSRGAPLPATRREAAWSVDASFIAQKAGVWVESVMRWRRRQDVSAYFEEHAAPAHYDGGVTDSKGAILAAGVARNELATWKIRLETACLIVILYLTGMRPGEVLALRRNSLFTSTHAEAGWKLIHSVTFKTAHDDEGIHDSRGQLREAPWVAIEPVVTAIRTMESLSKVDLLFPSPQFVKYKAKSLSLNTLIDRIAVFVSWARERGEDVGPAVPEDVHGNVTPSRLRRTLAWHIANQPEGIVALAIQYGHLRTAIAAGYASRARDGIQSVVDFETAQAIASSLSDVGDGRPTGTEGVSGASARQFLHAVMEQSKKFGGSVATIRQARELLQNPRLNVFANKQSKIFCNYVRERALCHTDSIPEPSNPQLDHCVPTCTNISLTDTLANERTREADRLDRDVALGVSPTPILNRQRARSEQLRLEAARHFANRITVEDVLHDNG
ncbi:hypothetical protein [Frondihabitans cladoniiphilus]|uniref:Integrase n=1 Tax=Frondihabitans cladoniiphilus TaxID=715785 RepID=A0ABP8VMX9_9MICO